MAKTPRTTDQADRDEVVGQEPAPAPVPVVAPAPNPEAGGSYRRDPVTGALEPHQPPTASTTE